MRLKRWLARGLAGALLLWLFLLGRAHAETLPVEEVATRLEEAARLIEAGNVEEARTLLSAVTAVRFEDGRVMLLESEGFLHLLEEEPEEAALALRTAVAFLREPTTSLPPDARERLERILARPEFQPAQPTLWERFLRWLWEHLPFPDGDPGALGDLLLWGIALFSGLIVGGVLLSFFRGLRQSIVEQEDIRPLEGDIPLLASEAQARATEAANAGNFREAMRLLYLAALLHLDEVGLIRFNRALTNREVLTSVSENAPLRAVLAPVVAQFDRVWYGHAPFGREDFEGVREQIEQLRTMGGRR